MDSGKRNELRIGLELTISEARFVPVSRARTRAASLGADVRRVYLLRTAARDPGACYFRDARSLVARLQ
jgi:hypothetical protein